MAVSFSNDDILQQLRLGIIDFEISSSPVSPVSTHSPRSWRPFFTFSDATPRFFARIGTLADSGSPALKKVERFSVRRVTGDGRCLFRALVKGMALNKGVALSPQEERENADDLRMAVREVVCDNDNERHQYEEALIAITVEEPLRRYCQRIRRPDFWGGESELLVLSKLCCQHIVVYIPEHEHGGGGSGFIPIQEYGAEFCRSFKNKKAVRLLYTDRLFNRQRTIYEVLGGGIVADVILWRRKNLTEGILVVTLAAWVVFEISGYTLLSLASSVFLLLFTILFLWAKSAAILNRPAPPLPHLYLSEEMVNVAATFIREHANAVLSASEDIALGRDSRMFIKVGLSLFIISVIGSLTDFLTLGYTSLVLGLTAPALYERYERHIESCALVGYRKLQELYVRFKEEYIAKIHNWILEKKKLS